MSSPAERVRRMLRPLYRRVRTNSLRTQLQKNSLLRRGDLSAKERRMVESVSNRVSPDDGMYYGRGAGRYFQVGLSAMRCIESVLEAVGVGAVKTVLDLPCGHGRVLRFLARRFPEAQLTACDLDRGAVDFCARAFGARPVYSSSDLNTLRLDKRFDLIWCGSLLTHLGSTDSNGCLQFFSAHLAHGGLAIFTAHGEHVAKRLRRGDTYGLRDDDVAPLLSSYEQTGYGYADYPDRRGYGISLMSPAWVRGQLVEIEGWSEVSFGAAVWDDHHDVWGIIRHHGSAPPTRPA